MTAAGLEEFDELENPKKQNLIKRLLKAEAWHDAKGGKRKKPTTGKRGSLMEAYATRWRSAHNPVSGGDELTVATVTDRERDDASKTRTAHLDSHVVAPPAVTGDDLDTSVAGLKRNR